MVRNDRPNKEGSLETWISYVLICGVVISLVLEVAGIVLFYRTFHSVEFSHDRSMLIHGRDFFTFLAGLFRRSWSGVPGIRLMILGVAILILTPYVRAVMSVIYFASQRNLKYFVITLFVLIVLTVSLAVH